MADTIIRYLYFLSFRIVQLNHGSVLLMIQLQNGAKMVVEPGGVHVLDVNGSRKSHGTCELGGGEWVCGHGCVHVLGVNGYGGKSSGTVRVGFDRARKRWWGGFDPARKLKFSKFVPPFCKIFTWQVFFTGEKIKLAKVALEKF